MGGDFLLCHAPICVISGVFSLREEWERKGEEKGRGRGKMEERWSKD